MTNKIEEIVKKIKDLEEKISYEYRTCPYNFDDQQAEHFTWYKAVIVPLTDEKERLNRELYKEQLFNVKVGDGVTTWTWTDRYAYTVISRTPKTITIQRDIAKRIDHNGMSDCQEYSYEQDPNGGTTTFRWSDKKGRWVHSCYKLALGRDEYYDYSF